MKKAKIAFLIYTLKIGGAQRIALDLASYLKKDFEISIIVLGKKGAAWSAPGVKTYSVTQPICRPLKIIREIREIVAQNRISVIVSFMERANILTHYAFSTVKNVSYCLTIHNAPSVAFKNRGVARNVLINWFYGRFPKDVNIVAVSEGIKDDLQKMYGFNNVHVIHNGINPEFLEQQLNNKNIAETGSFNVVNVGRITFQKNQLLLLKIIKRLKTEIPNIHCQIIGDGPLRNALEKYSIKNNLAGNVTFLGGKKRPFSYVKKNSVFVLTSKFEGFGIVILESLYFGIPVVSINCKHGPKEILVKGNTAYGVVVEENMNEDALVDAFAGHLKTLFLSDDEYRRYSENGLERAKDFYIDTIGVAYCRYINKMIDNCAKKKEATGRLR